jgi:2-keto-3-deoxy-L-rhamnonate aldolase RhmA
MHDTIRKDAQDGRLLTGTWLSLGHADATEMAAQAGFDWLLFDHEHGVSDWRELQHQLQAAAAGGSAATVLRVGAIDAAVFKRAFDLGVHGLMVPDVRDAQTALQVVDLSRVPPLGQRGAATSTRNTAYGRDYAKYVATINEKLWLMAQIESIEGLAQAESIAAVDGIDVLFVGPTDLGIALGLGAGSPTDPKFREVLLQVAKAAALHGKAAGVLARDATQAQEYLDLGYSVISMGSDRGILAQGMRQCAKQLRDLAS